MTATSSPRFIALNREAHADLRMIAPTDVSFAADYSLVPVVTAEFASLAREYAIVFARDAHQNWMPVVLTGAPRVNANPSINDGINVYVEQGQWRANYVPAIVRRHPFVFAETAADQLTVCIDESCGWFNKDEGTALFDNGEPSQMLQAVIARMTDYQLQVTLTQAFAKRIADAGLLVEGDTRIELNGRRIDVKGFAVIDENKLRALPADVGQQWFANGDLGLIYAHLLSLGNLLELLRRQPQGADVPATAATMTTSATESVL